MIQVTTLVANVVITANSLSIWAHGIAGYGSLLGFGKVSILSFSQVCPSRCSGGREIKCHHTLPLSLATCFRWTEVLFFLGCGLGPLRACVQHSPHHSRIEKMSVSLPLAHSWLLSLGWESLYHSVTNQVEGSVHVPADQQWNLAARRLGWYDSTSPSSLLPGFGPWVAVLSYP